MENKEKSLILQKIDCNCNDCKFLQRDFIKFNSFDELHKNNAGQVTRPAHRINYGNCTKLQKEITFIPNLLQIHTQECFQHRKD